MRRYLLVLDLFEETESGSHDTLLKRDTVALMDLDAARRLYEAILDVTVSSKRVDNA